MTQISEDQIIDIVPVKPVTALEFLISMRPAIPMSIEKPNTQTSNSELRRWLDSSSVVINGVKPKAKDKISFPVTNLIFFPKSKSVHDNDGKLISFSRKTTVI